MVTSLNLAPPVEPGPWHPAWSQLPAMSIRGRLRRVGLLVILAMAVIGPIQPAAATQTDAAEELDVEGVELDELPQITLRVVAPPDLIGRQLTNADFTLFQDGRSLPTTVTPARQDDLDLVLAFDTSGSMRGVPLAAAKNAAVQFVDRMPPNVRIAVLSFGSSARLTQDFTNDHTAVTAAIDNLEASGETALFDALAQAAGLVDTSDATRSAILLLSDGGDTVSSITANEALAPLVASGARFFAIGLESPEVDLSLLQGIAAASGGESALATDPDALDAAYERVAANLVDLYEITSTAAAVGATDLTIELRAGNETKSATLTVFVPDPTDRGARADAAARPVPGLRPGTLVTIGALDHTAVRAIGIAVVFIGLLLAVFGVIFAGRSSLRLSDGTTRTFVTGIADRAVAVADTGLRRSYRSADVRKSLERAGLVVRPGEYVVLIACAIIAAFAFGLVVAGPILAVVCCLAAAAAGAVIPRVRARRRQAAFAGQLGEILQLLAGSLRAGHGLLRSIEAAAHEVAAPAREELGRVITETRLGRPLGEALMTMATRMDSADFAWLTQAIEIHREVGGDLAEVLDNVGATVRERLQVQRQIHSLAAEGRLSGIILGILPVAVGVFLSIVSPAYLSELFRTGPGLVLIAVGLALLALGSIWIARISRLRF